MVATVAPEIPGGVEVVEALAGGLSGSDWPQPGDGSETAFGFGRRDHRIHAPVQRDDRVRTPQSWTVALRAAHGVYAEFICDLIHVNEPLVLAAYRAIPEPYAITDATSRPVVRTGNSISAAARRSSRTA